MSQFIDNIVVKTFFILMLPFSTTGQYRTRVTLEAFDTMLTIFHRKNLKKYENYELYEHENNEHWTVCNNLKLWYRGLSWSN